MWELFFHRVPGKSGKPGGFSTPGMTMDATKGTASFGHIGETPRAKRRWREFYARALHKVALGAVAWTRGVSLACATELDGVAEYIRRGGPFRPYAAALGRWIDIDVHLAFEVCGDPMTTLTVAVQISSETLWLTLAGSPPDPAAITAPFVRLVRGPDPEPNTLAERTYFCEGLGTGTAAVYRVPALPLHLVVPILHTYPVVQELRTDCPRWRMPS
jgi:hypothetical protein